MAKLLTTEERQALVEWRESLWNKGAVTRLAKRTLSDLSALHPGAITVYRGGRFRSQGNSWSKSLAIAESYGKPVKELKLTTGTPALDVNRALRGVPSK